MSEIADERLRDIVERTEGHTEGPWSFEPHGPGEALYSGRDFAHHGLNLGTMIETDRNWLANKELIIAANDLFTIATELDAENQRLRDEIARASKVFLACIGAAERKDCDSVIEYAITASDECNAALAKGDHHE
jgi:hypothetical protein